MKNKVIALAIVALSLSSFAAPVGAETIGNVYLPTNNACQGSDHVIWSTVAGQTGVVQGCIPAADWSRGTTQINTGDNVIAVARGQVVILASGATDSCPTWFPPFGCVIAKSLFSRFQ